MIVVKRDYRVCYVSEETLPMEKLIAMYDPFQFNDFEDFDRFYRWNQIINQENTQYVNLLQTILLQ